MLGSLALMAPSCGTVSGARLGFMLDRYVCDIRPCSGLVCCWWRRGVMEASADREKISESIGKSYIIEMLCVTGVKKVYSKDQMSS